MKNKIWLLFAIVLFVCIILSEISGANYYIISGRIFNNRVELNDLLKSEYSSMEFGENLSSLYSMEFFNKQNQNLKSFHFSTAGNLTNYAGETYKEFFSIIDVPYNISRLTIKNNGNTIKEYLISINPPVISSISASKISSNLYNISWNSYDPDNDILKHYIYYQCNYNEDWDLIEMNVTVKNYILYTSHLGGGDCKIKIIVSDGYNKNSIISNAFSVPNKKPYAVIVTPDANSTFYNYNNSTNITFEGFAYDPEIGILNNSFLYNWMSSINGFIGNGISFVYSALSLGNHTITFNAIDDVGNIGADSINITLTDKYPCPKPCSELTSSNSCKAVSGCSWFSGCIRNYDCSVIGDEETCGPGALCTWSNPGGEGTCDGSGSCVGMPSELCIVANNIGCGWRGEYCGGTVNKTNTCYG